MYSVKMHMIMPSLEVLELYGNFKCPWNYFHKLQM